MCIFVEGVEMKRRSWFSQLKLKNDRKKRSKEKLSGVNTGFGEKSLTRKKKIDKIIIMTYYIVIESSNLCLITV